MGIEREREGERGRERVSLRAGLVILIDDTFLNNQAYQLPLPFAILLLVELPYLLTPPGSFLRL